MTLLLLPLALGQPAGAQAPAPLALSYEEALRRAGESSAGVLGAEQDVRVAEGAVLAARAPFSPTFTLGGNAFSVTDEDQFQFGDYFVDTSGYGFSAGLTQALATGTTVGLTFDSGLTRFLYRIEGLEEEFGDPAWNSRLAVTVSQSLLQGTRLGWNLQGVRNARLARSIAEATRQSARQSALAQAAAAYWALHHQRALVEIARQTLALSEEQERVVDALVAGGRLAPVERTRIQAQVAQSERALLQAASAEEEAADALMLLMGADPGAEVTLTSRPHAPPQLALDEAAVVEAVLQGNPDAVAARIALERAQAAVRDARHQMLPELGATASYGLKGFEAGLAPSLAELGSGELPEWSVGAELSIPIFNLADRGALLQADAEAERANIELAALGRDLARQARAQVRVLETARRNLDLAQLDVRLAEETLAAERALLDEGRALQRDVIEALNALDRARVEAEKALTDYQIAVVELERLKGTL